MFSVCVCVCLVCLVCLVCVCVCSVKRRQNIHSLTGEEREGNLTSARISFSCYCYVRFNTHKEQKKEREYEWERERERDKYTSSLWMSPIVTVNCLCAFSSVVLNFVKTFNISTSLIAFNYSIPIQLIQIRISIKWHFVLSCKEGVTKRKKRVKWRNEEEERVLRKWDWCFVRQHSKDRRDNPQTRPEFLKYWTKTVTHSLIHSFTHSFTHSLIHSIKDEKYSSDENNQRTDYWSEEINW
jgi:hypothetical protein